MDANANGPGGIRSIWNSTNVPLGRVAGFTFGTRSYT